LLWASALRAAPAELRVCADPNNLPYSNQQQQGFENALAQMVGHDLGMAVTYTWSPQRHKFFRNTLEAGVCDVIMEVPAGIESARATIPYYRSTYVFVTRRDRDLLIRSFDDPRLHALRIGVQITGDNDDHLPTTSALLKRGLVSNLKGFNIFGKLSDENPAANVIHAVANKDVDVALVWGPLGGYFAKQSTEPLDVRTVCPAPSDQNLKFSFDISMGVRPGDDTLLEKLNAFITRRRAEISRLLDSYAIPTLATPQVQCEEASPHA
jgi:quinoprotein dehydrogenase-associated probable ABC transporter substrate-binding protein